MSKKRALITGITGQDGSYLAELLLSKDYEVFGSMINLNMFHNFAIQNFQYDLRWYLLIFKMVDW